MMKTMIFTTYYLLTTATRAKLTVATAITTVTTITTRRTFNTIVCLLYSTTGPPVTNIAMKS
jgi:hypothetical protein